MNKWDYINGYAEDASWNEEYWIECHDFMVEYTEWLIIKGYLQSLESTVRNQE